MAISVGRMCVVGLGIVCRVVCSEVRITAAQVWSSDEERVTALETGDKRRMFIHVRNTHRDGTSKAPQMPTRNCFPGSNNEELLSCGGTNFF